MGRVYAGFGVMTVAAMAALSGNAYAMNPPADNTGTPVLHSTLRSLAGPDGSAAQPIADVKPGDVLSIVGECVMQGQSADALRVVLRLTKENADDGPGFRSVLATDQEISGNILNVRVPDVPEAANRVFAVKVFRLGEQMPEICDAGAIRIGSRTTGKIG
jgi:hypothetical protein